MELIFFKKIFFKAKNETVFLIATLGAFLTSFLVKPDSSDINLHVLMILFNLMVVVEIYKKEKVLDKIAINFLKKYDNQRLISAILLSLVFFSSMLLTNDVALITFVPLTLIISKKSNFNPLKLIILETLCANIGGALTPMGSPQNLFIFSKFNLTGNDFFKVSILLSVVGYISILFLNLFTPKDKLSLILKTPNLNNKNNVIAATIIFLAVISSIFFKLNISIITLSTILYIISQNKKKFLNIDWFLLATFISFFIFVGNLSEIHEIRQGMEKNLSSSHKIFFITIFSSQFISNVPAAILISEFTNDWRAVLLGSNIGSFGTLIASLASLISYKLYINEFPEEKNSFLKKFTVLNFGFLAFLTTIFYFFI